MIETPSAFLEDVIATDALRRRPGRPPDLKAESQALEALANQLVANPHLLHQRLTEIIVDQGIADSAGISIIEPCMAPERFRWVALAGTWGHFRGGSMPFDASPCGVVIQRNRMLLFEHPERFFPAAKVEPLIHEILLVPFRVDGRAVGTVWVTAHSAVRKFDQEDARLLSKFARFAAAGFQVIQALGDHPTG